MDARASALLNVTVFMGCRGGSPATRGLSRGYVLFPSEAIKWCGRSPTSPHPKGMSPRHWGPQLLPSLSFRNGEFFFLCSSTGPRIRGDCLSIWGRLQVLLPRSNTFGNEVQGPHFLHAGRLCISIG